MASNVSEVNDEQNHKMAKVSQLESEVDALTLENSELFVLLHDERRKSKQLQNELELLDLRKKSSEHGKTGEETSHHFLQNVVVTLKAKLDTKESECEELEDKLSVMNQELAAQREELARSTLEFEHQLKHLHKLLAQERDLNSLLSEESDQTVHELETRMHEKDEMNTELKVIQDETSERMHSIEEECRLYQSKLHDTETRLRIISSEHEQSSIQTDSVSCQVSESDLQVREENDSYESRTLYQIFTALWENGDEINRIGNATRYKMDIFDLIKNGFSNLGGNILA